MKKIIKLIVFFIIIFLMLLYSNEIMENIRFSFSLCINNLFPSLIPFMLLSNILINYNFINDLSEILGNVTKFFKVSKNSSFAIIMSIISGTPSNAKYLKDLYDNNLISLYDLNKCLTFCHFTNPIFILGTIGLTFLNSKKMGLIILIAHYLSSIIIGLFGKKNIENKISNSKTLTNNNFIKVLTTSIESTINTLLLILGIITSFIIVSCIINNLFNINTNYKFIYGLLEITQGLKYLSMSNLDIKIKAIIASFIISFGGICVHAQVFSILDNKNVKYLPYFISRIIHGIMASIICFLIIKLLY